MLLPTKSGRKANVAEKVILAAAGAIYASRRQTFGGPTKTFECRWCGLPLRGRIALTEHQRECDRSPAALLGVEAFTG